MSQLVYIVEDDDHSIRSRDGGVRIAAYAYTEATDAYVFKYDIVVPYSSTFGEGFRRALSAADIVKHTKGETQ